MLSWSSARIHYSPFGLVSLWLEVSANEKKTEGLEIIKKNMRIDYLDAKCHLATLIYMHGMFGGVRTSNSGTIRKWRKQEKRDAQFALDGEGGEWEWKNQEVAFMCRQEGGI